MRNMFDCVFARRARHVLRRKMRSVRISLRTSRRTRRRQRRNLPSRSTIKIGGPDDSLQSDDGQYPDEKRKRRTAALLYSTAYTRSDVKDPSQRPLAFVYNGGPGSASVWLHMGSFATEARSDGERRRNATCALQAGRQSEFPTRQDRFGFHRSCGHGLQPRGGQSAGQGLLGRGFQTRSRSRNSSTRM